MSSTVCERARGRGAFLLVTVVALTGCVYFNTFYNAKKYYREGERLAGSGTGGAELPPPARTAFEKSIEKSSAVLASHPASDYADDALLLLAKAHFRLGNPSGAAAALQSLLADHRESDLREEAGLWLVRVSRETGDVATATRNADELLARGDLSGPTRLEVALERAQLFVDEGQADRAIRIYEELERRDPGRARRAGVAILLARARLANGDSGTALRELRALLSSGSDARQREQAAVVIAEALPGTESGEKALRTYQELLQGDVPDSLAARLRFALGETYEASGDARAAVDELSTAASLLPSTALAAAALYRRGLIEWRILRSRDGAKQTFLEAYLQDPEAPLADSAAAAARAIQEIQHYEAILAGSERVLSPVADDEVRATATYLLAELLYMQERDSAAARTLFEDLVERHPRSPWAPKALYTLGWLAGQPGDENAARADGGTDVASGAEGARAYYRRLVEQFPGSEYARFAAEKLSPVEPAHAGLDSALASDGRSGTSQPAAAEAPASLPATDAPEDPGSPPPGPAVTSTDDMLLAFTRALPKAPDPLLGIQDRLLARGRAAGGPEATASDLREAETERRLAAAERASAVRDSVPAPGAFSPHAESLAQSGPLAGADSLTDRVLSGAPGARTASTTTPDTAARDLR